jgi:hypothetical protein
VDILGGRFKLQGVSFAAVVAASGAGNAGTTPCSAPAASCGGVVLLALLLLMVVMVSPKPPKGPCAWGTGPSSYQQGMGLHILGFPGAWPCMYRMT